jgi:hypothetical protein
MSEWVSEQFLKQSLKKETMFYNGGNQREDCQRPEGPHKTRVLKNYCSNCRISGSHSSYEELYIRGYKAVQSVES